MKQGQLFKYLRELRELPPDLAIVRKVRNRHTKGSDEAKISEAEIRLALIEELAGFARARDKNAEARALIFLLDNESGLERHMIFDSILNARDTAAA